MRNWRRTLALVLAGIMTASCVSMDVWAVEPGTILEPMGEDIAGGFIENEKGGITWKIDSNLKLTVDGKGEIGSSDSRDKAPWSNYMFLSADINLSEIKDASYLFYDCSYLVELDVSDFDTSQVTDMSYMFYDCWRLSDVDLSSFDTSQVTDMSYMFYGCEYMAGTDITGFDTSQVTDMSYMFYNCSDWTDLDVSNFDTSQVTDMSYMFCGSERACLDVKEFDTSRVTNMEGMFSGCYSNEESELDLSNFDTSQVTNMSHMFSDCLCLTEVDLSSFDTGKVTDMSYMFSGCVSFTSLDFTNFNTSQVTNMEGMFSDCYNQYTGLELDFSSFDTSCVTNMSHMFSGSSYLTDLDVSGFKTSQVTDMSYMFYDCGWLNNLELRNFDTSQVTDMSYMFYGCSGLNDLNLSSFNTSKVTNMSYMFADSLNIKKLDVSGFDTGNVTDMNHMFSHCQALTELDVSGFETSQVTDMSYMFNLGYMYYPGEKLKVLDVSGFDTSRVTNMEGMFMSCEEVLALDVSGFDTSQVTDMSYMFSGCDALTELDLSGFDMEQVVSADDMVSAYSVSKICLPLHVSCDIELPAIGQDVWYLSDSSQIKAVPKNLKYSLAARRNQIPSADEDQPAPEDIVVDGLAINGSGKAYARFLLEDNKGNVLKDTNVRYTFDDVTIKEVKSDADGYVIIESETLTNTGKTTEKKNLTAKIMIPSGSDYKELDAVVEMKVDVLPLSFEQEWELILDASAGAGIGFEVGAGLGAAEVEARLAGADIEGGLGGSLSVKNSHENGSHNLELLQKYNTKIAAKADIGPAAEANVLGSDMSLGLLNLNASVQTAKNVGVGLKIKDYDPNNSDHGMEVGKFLFGTTAQASGNYMLLLAAIAMDTNYNKITFEESYLLEAGVDIGSIEVEGEDDDIGTLAGISDKSLISYSWDVDSSEPKITESFEYTVNNAYSFGTVNLGTVNKDFLSKEFAGSMKLDVEKNISGDVDKIAINEVFEDSEGRLLLTETAKESVEVAFEKAEAARLYRWNPILKSFIKGDKHFILGNERDTMVSFISSCPAQGTYISKTELKKLSDLELNFNIQAIAGVGIGLELEGVESYSYETGRGTYTQGIGYPVSSTDIEEMVKANKQSIVDLVIEPWYGIAELVKNCWNDISDTVVNGVKNAGAAIVGTGEEILDWIVHIVSVKKEDESALEVQSFSVCTYSENGTEEGTAFTVGDPYSIYVTDENGAEITDYSACPLKLTLSYTDEMLQAAGVNPENVNSLAIYVYSSEVCGYIYQGGVIDAVNQTVSLDITKPGQYVIAVDTAAPMIKNFNVSDATGNPTIAVDFDEISGFGEFSMKLDGEEVINSQNWKDYYNGSYKRIVYKVEDALADGEHTVTIYAVDGAGNAMAEPEVFTFTVDTVAPSLERTVVSVDSEHLRIRAWSKHEDVNYVEANVTWVMEDESTMFEKISMDVMEGYYTVFCERPENALFSKVVLRIVDVNGNTYESEEVIKNFENPESDVVNDLWIRFVDGEGEFRSEYKYTGSAIKPQVQIYEGTVLLKANKDYTLSYKNNTKVGTAAITVKGKGDYEKSETATFTIVPKNIADEDVTAKDIVVAANGKQQLKVPTVQLGKKKLTNKKDFIVTWPDETEGAYKDSGTYTIRLEGIGNYTGQREVQLVIGEKTASKLSVSKIASQSYTGEEIRIDNLTVKDGKKVLEEGTDYTVSYENNVNIGKANVIITGIAPKYVGTKTVTFSITGISMSKVKVASASVPKSVDYSGKVHEPEPVLTYQKSKKSEVIPLVKDTDYTVAYKNNTNAGTATIILTGIGKYTGTIKKTFKINPFDIKKDVEGKFTVESIDPISYAKGGAKPAVVVKYEGRLLTQGSDYTLSYSNNSAVTKETTKKLPVVKIKLKGNFKGTWEEKFEIKAQELELLTAEVSDKVYSKKKGAWKSALKITDLDGKTLKAGTDYNKTLMYYTDAECTTEVGDAIPDAGTSIWVKAEGKGNYVGSSMVVQYRITKASIASAKVKVTSKYYTGKAIEPGYEDITSVKVGKQELVKGVDYEIVENSYTNNVKAGTATMKLKGKDNYGGVVTVKFTIKKKPFIWRWFE